MGKACLCDKCGAAIETICLVTREGKTRGICRACADDVLAGNEPALTAPICRECGRQITGINYDGLCIRCVGENTRGRAFGFEPDPAKRRRACAICGAYFDIADYTHGIIRHNGAEETVCAHCLATARDDARYGEVHHVCQWCHHLTQTVRHIASEQVSLAVCRMCADSGERRLIDAHLERARLAAKVAELEMQLKGRVHWSERAPEPVTVSCVGADTTDARAGLAERANLLQRPNALGQRQVIARRCGVETREV